MAKLLVAFCLVLPLVAAVWLAAPLSAIESAGAPARQVVSEGSALPSQNPKHQPGHLVIAGGGPLPHAVLAKALSLSGGEQARVLVIPLASGWAEAGQYNQQMWQDAGVKQVNVLDTHDRIAAVRAVKSADLIWMSGGDQERLMQDLTGLGLTKAIRDRYLEGATVGGTSAGAAVMSQIMLAGWTPDRSAAREAAGLGLWPDVIVDQHFLRRQRLPRLLSAVLHHPDKIGIGIDESTAVVVRGHRFEVIGESQVYVLDARRAGQASARTSSPAQDNVVRHVLQPGMTFDLERGSGPAPTSLSRRPVKALPGGARAASAPVRSAAWRD